MASRGQDKKLSLTSNSLVSPADLEPVSEFNEEAEAFNAQQPCLAGSTNEIHLTHDSSRPAVFALAQIEKQQQLSKDGPLSPKEMSPEMARRLLQNMTAIEKDLKLVPAPMTQKIVAAIQEDDKEGLASETSMTKRRLDLEHSDSISSPAFPNRESSALCQQKPPESQAIVISETTSAHLDYQLGGHQEFEECVIDFKTNSFGNSRSRQYIDDMTSSSGQISGLSENLDCFPVIEQVEQQNLVGFS